MMRYIGSLALATLAVTAGGCGGGGSEVIECTAGTMCLKGGVQGHCAVAPTSSKSYCAYPDVGCPSGERWGLFAGEGLAERCVSGNFRVTPMQQALGAVPLGGMSSDFPFTVTNTAGTASGVPSVTLLDTVNYTLTLGTCGAVIAPGSSCSFSVRFHPTTVGEVTSSVMVSAQPGGDSTVSLSGTGTATLSVTKQGSGAGTVTSAPAGLDCGGVCSFAFAASAATVTATPDPTAEFIGWSGAGCSGMAPCTITMDAAKTVTAIFEPKRSPPRPIAPLSTATATSRRPTFRWVLGPGTDGARVEICATRACAAFITTFDAVGASGAPTVDLPPGVVFWRLRPRVGAVTGLATSPTWQLVIGARTAPVSTSFGTTLDVNGDGYADVVVGAPGVSGNTGAAYLYLGNATGLPATPAPLPNPDASTGFFGWSVASAGDVNGDGFTDLVVGTGGLAGAGRAYVYHGSASGPVVPPVTTLTGPDGAGGGFGGSVSSAGDVNGDGYADVVIGASLVSSRAGRAYLFLGGPSGLASNPARTFGDGVSAAGDYFGSSVASAGDVNGDEYGDFLVGRPGYNGKWGGAFLYLGSATLPPISPPSTNLYGPGIADGWFGGRVAGVGDVNGDGYGDVMVGARGINGDAGRAYLYLGSTSGLTPVASSPSATLTGPDVALGSFGDALGGAGDVNGDGFADVMVSAPGINVGAGRSYLYLGGASGLAGSATTLTGPDVTNALFAEVAGAGDVNGDGRGDVVVGASGMFMSAGRAYLYLGTASGLATSPAVLSGPNMTNGLFGISVAMVDHTCGERLPAQGRPSCCAERRPRPG